MAKQTINIGTQANDRTGDPLRTAFTKVNDNFTELYANQFSGSYNDLTDLPTSAGSQLTNGESTFTLLESGAVNLSGSTLQADYTTQQVALGYSALTTSTGTLNTAIGYNTQTAPNGASRNTSVGASSLFNNTGNENVAIGTDSLQFNIGGNENVAVGYQAMMKNGAGSNNVAIGSRTLGASNFSGLSTGINNTAVGSYAGVFMASGSNNILIGYQAGQSLSTGSNNTIIGSITNTSSDLQNTVIIAAGSTPRLQIDSNDVYVNGEIQPKKVTEAPTTNKGKAGDRPGMFYVDFSYFYYCVGYYDNFSIIWRRIAWSGTTW